jgi:uncharacterized cupredoxin-like copper-binding protein
MMEILMRKMTSLLAACLLFGAAIASAQTPDWAHAKRIDINLSNFKFTPATITLQHGQPYVLHFVNRSSGGHDFMAKQFFAAAAIAPQDSTAIKGGAVALHGGEEAEVRLVAPAAGTYDAHCSHFLHSTFGMTGSVIVQ